MLIDHQPAIAMISPSLRTDVLINNVTGLAKTARALNVPTILTTVGATGSVLADPIFKEIAEVFRCDHACVDVRSTSRALKRDRRLTLVEDRELAVRHGATLVLGSAAPHLYSLHLGSYSVHTSAEALTAGERNIRELKQQLDAAGDRRTERGSTPVFRG